MDEVQRSELIKAAKIAGRFAYAPYSKFRVGVALLTNSGKIFTGCNVENISYGLTVCAERVATFKAISEGEKIFQAIVIYTKTKDFTLPCGACLQVLAEFTKDLTIVLANRNGKTKTYQLSELLPHRFS